MAGLKEHFGVWSRCGNTSFWMLAPRGTTHVFVDPIDAVLVSWDRYPNADSPGARLLRTFIPEEIHEETIGPAIESLPKHMYALYAWFMRALAVSAIFGWEKARMLRWFIETYHEQGEAYRQGTEKASEFKEPAREEVLTATLRVFQHLGDYLPKETRFVFVDEVPEALAEWGVVECPYVPAT